MQEKSRSPPKI